MIALSPTVPAPNTAVLEPEATWRTREIEPAPVSTPQPRGPRISSGRSFGTGTTLRAATSTWLANDDWPNQWAPIGEPAVSRTRWSPDLERPTMFRPQKERQ